MRSSCNQSSKHTEDVHVVVMLLTRVWEVIGSNPCRSTNYSDRYCDEFAHNIKLWSQKTTFKGKNVQTNNAVNNE
jgi:hypothetical protein